MILFKNIRISVISFIGMAGVFVALPLPPLEAENDGYLYSKAVEAAKEGRQDAAYAYYNAILRLPHSKYHKAALFAKAEYFFLSGDTRSSKSAWNVFLEQYPDIPETLFALVNCYYIARKDNDLADVEAIKQRIVQSRQISLIFRKSKDFHFTSPFFRHYRAVYSIDKIEFMIDDIPFETILY
ncbi:MAG: hypothetical protein WC450_03650 [Candidatus Omnitrophota bacterium]|jgi:tetratricopeptide (TPR) repeat protein